MYDGTLFIVNVEYCFLGVYATSSVLFLLRTFNDWVAWLSSPNSKSISFRVCQCLSNSGVLSVAVYKVSFKGILSGRSQRIVCLCVSGRSELCFFCAHIRSSVRTLSIFVWGWQKHFVEAFNCLFSVIYCFILFISWLVLGFPN